MALTPTDIIGRSGERRGNRGSESGEKPSRATSKHREVYERGREKERGTERSKTRGPDGRYTWKVRDTEGKIDD